MPTGDGSRAVDGGKGLPPYEGWELRGSAFPCRRGMGPGPWMAARDCRPTRGGNCVGRHSHADGGWVPGRGWRQGIAALRRASNGVGRHSHADGGWVPGRGWRQGIAALRRASNGVGRHSHADGAKPSSRKPRRLGPGRGLRQGIAALRRASNGVGRHSHADGAKPSSRKPCYGYPGSARGRTCVGCPGFCAER
jgi:hypothetical protein